MPLYSWCSQTNCTDGANPQSAFVETSDGSFWGTTIGGGANNKGTVFTFVPGNVRGRLLRLIGNYL